MEVPPHPAWRRFRAARRILRMFAKDFETLRPHFATVNGEEFERAEREIRRVLLEAATEYTDALEELAKVEKRYWT